MAFSATERRLAERAFHERQAQERAADFRRRQDVFSISELRYLEHETWIRPALARLGTVERLSVLDYGCGHGMAAVVLARRGARVTAFDLSHGYLSEAALRARQSGLNIDHVQ